LVSHDAPGLLANGQGDLGLIGAQEASRPGGMKIEPITNGVIFGPPIVLEILVTSPGLPFSKHGLSSLQIMAGYLFVWSPEV